MVKLVGTIKVYRYNTLSHIWQVSRPSLVWILMWYLSFCFFEKTTSQTGQAALSSPV